MKKDVQNWEDELKNANDWEAELKKRIKTPCEELGG